MAVAIALAVTASAAAGGRSGQRFLAVAALLPSYESALEILDSSGRVVRVVAQPGRAEELVAAWSPDGSRLVWADSEAMWVERADGAGKRVLLRFPGGCTQVCVSPSLAWSPDGRSLLVGGAGAQTNRLLVVSVADGRSRDLVPPRRLAEYTALGWSTDGRVLYKRFTGDPGTASCCSDDLVVYRSDGSGARRLFSAADGGIHDSPVAAGSPDGSKVAFTTDARNPRDPRFAVVDVRTGGLHVIRGISPMLTRPAWSPDSRRLAVARADGSAVTLAADGGGGRRLGAAGSLVAWSRGGDLFVVGGAHDELVYRSSGGRSPAHLLFRMPRSQSILTLDPGG